MATACTELEKRITLQFQLIPQPHNLIQGMAGHDSAYRYAHGFKVFLFLTGNGKALTFNSLQQIIRFLDVENFSVGHQFQTINSLQS